MGVERLVLDDGWFAGRRDAAAGLGDWTADPRVWPNGLAPLADRVHDLGMQFALWVEPEMVNLGSDLARGHPESLLAPSCGLGPSSRHQYVLNLADQDACQHICGALDTLVNNHRVDFLKWDLNRELHEAVRRGPDGRDHPGVHAQVLALYRTLDALRERAFAIAWQRATRLPAHLTTGHQPRRRPGRSRPAAPSGPWDPTPRSVTRRPVPTDTGTNQGK